ncbi:MAG: EamA family transporter RarD [Polyangiales bacterium]
MTTQLDHLDSRAHSEVSDSTRGLIALLIAFSTWGVLVLYLRLLHHVPAGQIMACRLVFCAVFVSLFLWARGAFSEVVSALRNPQVRRRLFASAALISVNWLVFTWAVTHDHVIEGSLGYFINPLVSVLLGVLVLRERLRRAQWLAVAIAACGVAYMTWLAGAVPWLALVLAVSFGAYGLLRKTVQVDAMAGLAAETLLIAPLGFAYLVYCELQGVGPLRHAESLTTLGLLAGSGIVTAVPLWLFSYGARRVPLATVGLMQYIAPSLQLVFGIAVFNERFDQSRAVGFAFIWLALALYAFDGLYSRERVPAR